MLPEETLVDLGRESWISICSALISLAVPALAICSVGDICWGRSSAGVAIAGSQAWAGPAAVLVR